jgi:hypothetical protein
MEQGLASYAATQGQNNTQHYYAGNVGRPKKGRKMACTKKNKKKPGKK